ncbi:MAG: HD domain-containing phosphohydrolase [Poseidonibacter sp.]|uniref:HD domain-containing phosphohydrolase n=1 Tax=Poseidonibacter sp. TaxID=2321188 RepID=UPI00359D83EF
MQEQIDNILYFSQKLNVLLIENNNDIKLINIFRELFFNLDYKNSLDAFAILKTKQIDLIIVNIENENDIIFLKEIKELNKSIPIMVISNFDNSNYLKDCLLIGVNAYILNPINEKQLHQEVLRTIQEIKLRHTQTNTVHKLTHALTLAKEYELAINESNILSRANLSGRITYVNDMFCQVSGYSKDELLGKKHNIIRHPDTPDSVFRSLWNHITKGKIWKGVVKNRNKNGKSYWVNTTIIPIKDKFDNVVEFMAIRHNLSELFSLHKELEDTQREIIYKMGEVGETRSKETGHHVKRVAQYSKDLALLYGLKKEEADILFTASPMHDIGKVGIPDHILKKPGKLTPEEFDIMKTHAEIGYNILKGSQREILKAAAIISLTHHEKYDGSGYPKGTKGEDIHIYGRITAIADVFDALGSNRVYKKAWEDEKIFKLLEEGKGKHFDPELIELFMTNKNIFLETRKKYQD